MVTAYGGVTRDAVAMIAWRNKMTPKVKKYLTRYGFAAAWVVAFFVWAYLRQSDVAPVEQQAAARKQMTPGQIAYEKAFRAYETNFRLLGDPDDAKRFAANWQHRFDASGKLATEEGTQAAIEEMSKVGSLLGCPQKFDGNCLFERARRAYLRIHYNLGEEGIPDLTDAKQRAEWSAQIDKLIDPKLFETEEGSYTGIRQMRDTLHMPFDYAYSPAMTRSETNVREAHFPGIGVPMDVTNVEKNKLGGLFHFFFGRPQPGSPVFEKVQLGDVILAVNDRSLDGFTIEEAKALFVGKPGETVRLKVQRDQASEPFDVDAVFTCAPDVPQCSSNASLGVDLGITHLNEIKLSSISQMMALAPLEGSPAIGKLMAGDLIIAVNGESLDGLMVSQVVERIHGAVNTPVTLKVKRKDASGNFTQFDVSITRKIIEKHAVHYTALPDGIGLVVLDQISSLNVPADFAVAIARTVLPLAKEALKGKTDAESVRLSVQFDELNRKLAQGETLDDAGMRIAMKARDVYEELGQGGGLILDLTHNPGGEKSIFLELAGEILPEGLVVSLREREIGSDRIMIHEDTLTPAFLVSSDRPLGTGVEGAKIHPSVRVPLLLPKKMPFKVLVGPHTASAAELTAGMLQSHKRAILIGQSLPDKKRHSSTLGKGSGQATIPLPYGYSLHVTYLEFYPGGEKSNGRGLIADLDAEGLSAQRELAIAEIKKDNLAMAERMEDRGVAKARNQQLLGDDMRDRAAEDLKPIRSQDPTRFK